MRVYDQWDIFFSSSGSRLHYQLIYVVLISLMFDLSLLSLLFALSPYSSQSWQFLLYNTYTDSTCSTTYNIHNFSTGCTIIINQLYLICELSLMLLLALLFLPPNYSLLISYNISMFITLYDILSLLPIASLSNSKIQSMYLTN